MASLGLSIPITRPLRNISVAAFAALACDPFARPLKFEFKRGIIDLRRLIVRPDRPCFALALNNDPQAVGQQPDKPRESQCMFILRYSCDFDRLIVQRL
jgi:hypothetical protein